MPKPVAASPGLWRSVPAARSPAGSLSPTLTWRSRARTARRQRHQCSSGCAGLQGPGPAPRASPGVCAPFHDKSWMSPVRFRPSPRHRRGSHSSGCGCCRRPSIGSPGAVHRQARRVRQAVREGAPPVASFWLLKRASPLPSAPSQSGASKLRAASSLGNSISARTRPSRSRHKRQPRSSDRTPPAAGAGAFQSLALRERP
jgi:hypothetical protein